MSECPIGLICELMECSPSACKQLAAPWLNPAEYNPCWFPDASIFVTIPEYSFEAENTEHELIAEENHNRFVEIVRRELFLHGWFSAGPLPYQSHPDGGLLVTENLRLDWETTFSCGINISKGYQSFPEESGFAIPIPLNCNFIELRKSLSKNYYQKDGFLLASWLIWMEDLEEYEQWE